ncbi:uncharacterized protein LDX57_003347 [Aspergillus melleus]|uniref:uncharacterized protein n=1 Tax=Aspergillus melleus TaxID=138277 RepID=UPI001E8E24FA|nr:uncharacterized protein LDX57_003347 [Aspergillus melleus]KAH8425598.1 hypothetical protein LDX57_003347 [Aspergillus melleus]
MFKALMGGNRSSSDVRSNSSSKSKSRRRTNSKGSTVSRKSSRGDDRDRGLGDLSAYPSSSSRSRRNASSVAGESVASSYATAEPGVSGDPDPLLIERAPRRRDYDDSDRRDRYRDDYDEVEDGPRRRNRARSPSRERERPRTSRYSEDNDDHDDGNDDYDDSRRNPRRTRSGDAYYPPVSGAPDMTSPHLPQFPPQFHNASPDSPLVSSPHAPGNYDPHVQQQFPGQFPAYVPEPYSPPNPAGEAADYYGDQGQSVAHQPGVRPKPPLVASHDQAHLMTASPTANPPPEPSSMGQVGAAAGYYTDDVPDTAAAEQPSSSSAPAPKPPRPSKPSIHTSGPAAAAATYGVGEVLHDSSASSSPVHVESPTSIHDPPAAGNSQKPPHSHGMGASFGAAAAGAAAGYAMASHHHSSSADHTSQYTMQNYEELSPNPTGQPGPSIYPPYSNAPAYAAGGAALAGYATDPSHPHHAAIYHSPPLHGGELAFQRPQRGPMDKFIDFWRDPEGVGMFEDYTEAIGVCKYCFEPGTTSRDAPRKHHYKARRNSGDRYSNGSRVDKLIRYGSSDDESRRRKKSSRNSWLPGVLAGYGVKSLFNNKDFDDTYSVRSGRVISSHDTESVSTARKSQTSRGVYRRSSRSRSGDRSHRSHRSYHTDSKVGKGEMLRIRSRSRSRSRSSSRTHSHSALRDAALGAAVGTAAVSVAKSRHRSSSRSRSPRKARSRTSSSSDSSVLNISGPPEKPAASGIGSFFSASSENRKKRRTKKQGSIFSFKNNSSSSSLDADLAFGNGYSKLPPGKSKKKKSKKDKKDLEARLLGMGAVATALVAARKHHRRPGEILAGKDSRSGRSDYTSSASNDEGWEDLDSGDQSPASVSSGLAFGGDDSHSSDSGKSIWGWRWGSKKGKKKAKKRSDSKDDHLPSAAALGAGALGTAALASAYSKSGRTTSQDAISSTGSLQHVAPVPTSDPSRFDAIRVSSIPPAQPTFVRPGPIPLQQPQPVTPVSQAVYTSQGEPIHAYSAPATGDLAFAGAPFAPYEQQPPETFKKGPWSQGGPPYPDDRDEPIIRPPRRSDSSPVFPTESLEGSQISALKRRSTTKDQASVSFDLTQEQEDKERRADRLDRLRRNAEYDGGVQLIDRESDMGSSRDYDCRSRRNKQRDSESVRDDGYNDDRRDYERDPPKSSDSSSWIGPAAVGAVSAAAAVSALSSRASHDDSSETSRRSEERREKRRAQRRGASEPGSTVSSAPMSDVADDRSFSPHEAEHIKTSAFRDVYRRKQSVHDDYAQFFAPEVQRYSPDTYHRREPTSMPTIIEVEPTNQRVRTLSEGPHPEYDNLPWPVPTLKLIEPTPPQSLSGSVRDLASPVMSTPEIIEAESPPERPTTGSRVSWGEHEMHEYEVPSTSSDHESVDHDLPSRSRSSRKDDLGDEELSRNIRDASPKNTSSNVEGDIDFAATVAAATAAAGFDPSLVTDDPTYHTRSSPPGSGIQFVSPWTRAPVEPREPHGFVEGEVETPDDRRRDGSPPRQFMDNEPLFSEPEPVTREKDVIYENKPRSTIAQEVIEQLGGRRDDRRRSQSPPDEALSMPGGFGQEDSPIRRSHDMPKDGFQSTPADFETPTHSRSRSSTDDLKLQEDDTASLADNGSEGKKKRRKRRSKRDTDDFEDSASVTSSPARIGESRDKSRSTDEKTEKKPGSFLSSIFGSKVSEPVDSTGSSSSDRRTSREVQSDIGTRSSERSRHRRKDKSSSRRSSSRADTLEGDSADEDSTVAEKENINVEGYKSSRQRREERRRQRHEGILESGNGRGDEKV